MVESVISSFQMPTSVIEKPMSGPFGVPSCDFVSMKKEEDAIKK